MAYLVELPMSTGMSDMVRVQIEEVTDGLVRVAGPGRVAARAARSLNDMLAGIRPVAENFVNAFRDMPDGPDEIGVEFGLALSADADLVISRTTGQANFTVTLTWRRPSVRGAQ
ncbi:CU044_2847 family protein [Streptomyces lancefieldiae]|uniref:CU044_2847 family protein n=1 Tax=Streptomyces lancefieldiae TaxID=3075520 RepID=A0ABU3APM4_9ACTN|nr:CU044_2847 family protein [Streptomyces sp. DSM 40712]MDT0612127.1 CU044_2847 family protein [Streptomyces sp. DSM 40712]